ncbi:MAG: hypothetical protein R2729_11295 [Bryobacteraceae bacterium]
MHPQPLLAGAGAEASSHWRLPLLGSRSGRGGGPGRGEMPLWDPDRYTAVIAGPVDPAAGSWRPHA